MRFVIQRVTEAAVRVDGELLGQIEKGYLVLIGVAESDTEEIADKMVKKMTGLRIFEDEQGKTNLALKDVGGSLLLVSQFTLYANCKKGNRPSFIEAGSPEKANALYEYIIKNHISDCMLVYLVTKNMFHRQKVVTRLIHMFEQANDRKRADYYQRILAGIRKKEGVENE